MYKCTVHTLGVREDNARHCSMLQHKCLMNTQASAEGAKTLYHEKDKQTEEVFFSVCQEKEKEKILPTNTFSYKK